MHSEPREISAIPGFLPPTYDSLWLEQSGEVSLKGRGMSERIKLGAHDDGAGWHVSIRSLGRWKDIERIGVSGWNLGAKSLATDS